MSRTRRALTEAERVMTRARPSAARAAAAARLAGAPRTGTRRPPAREGRFPLLATTSSAATALLVAPEPGPAPERPSHLRVVEPARSGAAWGRHRNRLILIGAMAAVTTVAFVLVYLHVLLAQRQFRIDRLENQVQQEQRVYQNLRLQVAQLGSPAQIIATAEGRLGMVQPAAVTYLTPPAGVPAAPVAQGPDGGAPAGSPASPAGLAGDADWPLIKSQLAGTP